MGLFLPALLACQKGKSEQSMNQPAGEEMQQEGAATEQETEMQDYQQEVGEAETTEASE